MAILIVGTGYVGLVAGSCLAEMGYQVVCLDNKKEKIANLNQGNIPIFEPGLEEIVSRNLSARRLSFTTDYKDAVENANILILAVDTPVGEDGSADLRSITAAAMSIGEHLNAYKVIVNKSTAPVGTADYIHKTITTALEKRNVTIDFDVVSNPEFLKEGSAVADFMRPDRIIIGSHSEKASQIMRDLYKPFMLSVERLFFMDIASAELTKYAANAMLATRISFMNWLSELAEKTGADITEIRKGIGSDKRIGLPFLWAGCGFGGSCFPKDLQALQAMAKANSMKTGLIDSVIEVNFYQKKLLYNKIETYFRDHGGIAGKTIGILGLAFKPDTDDMREAPSLILIEKLLEAGAFLRLYDPIAMPNAQKIIGHMPHIHWCDSEITVAENASALVLVTEWKQFRLLNYKRVIAQMCTPMAFFDGRNQYNPEEMAKNGFDYISIGRNISYSALAREFTSGLITKQLKIDA